MTGGLLPLLLSWLLSAGGNAAAPAPVRITFAAVGDVNFGTPRSHLQRHPNPLTLVAPLLAGRDIVYGNLETPVSARPLRHVQPPRDCAREACTKTQADYAYWHKITFWTSPDSLRMLKASGFTFFGTANNHALDQGPDGLRETIAHLKAAGLAFAGTGLTREDAWRPHVFEKQGVKVALFSVTSLLNLPEPPGVFVAFAPPERLMRELLPRVRDARKNADFVVVALHFGVEMEWRTARHEREWLQELAQAGCDLFIGTHPHVLRGISVHGSMPAIHSLGNFLFPVNADLRVETGVVHAEFVKDGSNRRIENVAFHPVRNDGGKPGTLPRPVTGRLARAILNNVLYYSKPLGNPPDTLFLSGDTLRVRTGP